MQLFQCHREEQRRFLRFARNRLCDLVLFSCHCERSDVAISTFLLVKLSRAALATAVCAPFQGSQ